MAAPSPAGKTIAGKPVWIWALAAVGVVIVYVLVKRKSSSTTSDAAIPSQPDQATGTSLDTTGATSGAPQTNTDLSSLEAGYLALLQSEGDIVNSQQTLIQNLSTSAAATAQTVATALGAVAASGAYGNIPITPASTIPGVPAKTGGPVIVSTPTSTSTPLTVSPAQQAATVMQSKGITPAGPRTGAKIAV
jgi:hypothetical protein